MTVATINTPTPEPFAAETPKALADLFRRMNDLPEQDPPSAERGRLIDRIAATPKHLFRELEPLA